MCVIVSLCVFVVFCVCFMSHDICICVCLCVSVLGMSGWVVDERVRGGRVEDARKHCKSHVKVFSTMCITFHICVHSHPGEMQTTWLIGIHVDTLFKEVDQLPSDKVGSECLQRRRLQAASNDTL